MVKLSSRQLLQATVAEQNHFDTLAELAERCLPRVQSFNEAHLSGRAVEAAVQQITCWQNSGIDGWALLRRHSNHSCLATNDDSMPSLC
jgi:hypothetical protein